MHRPIELLYASCSSSDLNGPSFCLATAAPVGGAVLMSAVSWSIFFAEEAINDLLPITDYLT